MDALVRGRRLLLILPGGVGSDAGPRGLVLVALLSSCAPRSPMAPVGVSTGGAVTTRGGATAASAPPPGSPIPADFRTALAPATPGPFAALGHAGGRFDAEVFVMSSAAQAVFAPSGHIEPGAAIVMVERPRAAAPGVVGPSLMMEKRAAGYDPAHGDWRYVVVDGAVISDGPLAACSGCHDEAPHDHVFALPAR